MEPKVKSVARINKNACTEVQAKYAMDIADRAGKEFKSLFEQYPNKMMDNAIFSTSSQIYLNIYLNLMLSQDRYTKKQIKEELKHLSKLAYEHSKRTIDFMIESIDEEK